MIFYPALLTIMAIVILVAGHFLVGLLALAVAGASWALAATRASGRRRQHAVGEGVGDDAAPVTAANHDIAMGALVLLVAGGGVVWMVADWSGIWDGGDPYAVAAVVIAPVFTVIGAERLARGLRGRRRVRGRRAT
jgi:hypothetical protein